MLSGYVEHLQTNKVKCFISLVLLRRIEKCLYLKKDEFPNVFNSRLIKRALISREASQRLKIHIESISQANRTKLEKNVNKTILNALPKSD